MTPVIKLETVYDAIKLICNISEKKCFQTSDLVDLFLVYYKMNQTELHKQSLYNKLDLLLQFGFICMVGKNSKYMYLTNIDNASLHIIDKICENSNKLKLISHTLFKTIINVLYVNSQL